MIERQPHRPSNIRVIRLIRAIRVVCCFLVLPVWAQSRDSVQIGTHELSRPARPWEFLDAVGKRAGLFGNEAGRFEAWVYPLKLFRDFEVTFVLDDRRIPASALVRNLVMRPEGPTLTLSSDSFSVNETWLLPPDESGAIIRFEISTWQPVAIEASFTRDFQLMWPAGLGGTYMSWNPELHAFTLGEEGRKFSAVVGSPSAVSANPEFSSNSYASTRSSFRLDTIPKGTAVRYIFIAGSTTGPGEARKSYDRLSANPGELFSAARKYYDDYLAKTLSVELPDPKLQAAYDWSRISMIQGLVANPFLGTGLVAGYRSSGETARPGYAWFFGRDSLWTDLALDSIGDFATTRTALEFIAKYQRADGKVEHEISQTTSLVDWWKGFPYGFASADATPLFIIAMNDYVTSSSDVGFATEHWDNVWRAYQFIKSTYNQNGLPRNFGIGHGWIEGGPLLPVETESYQSGLVAAALQSLVSLATAAGKRQDGDAVSKDFGALRTKINDAFWDANDRTLVFAVDRENKQVRTPTVLSTAPMWFDVFEAQKANATIDHIANWDHAADWGMRIISEQHPLYGPTGYHFGSVWPLFTGWAAVAEYRNHRPLEAYANLYANSSLALDGPLGRVTEVLSGSYYEGLGTSSPHQIWSSAMVISPIVRGMLGLAVHETKKTIDLAPHLPAAWDHLALHSIAFCGGQAEILYSRRDDGVHLQVKTGKTGDCNLRFSPSFSKHARVRGVTWNGKPAKYTVEPNRNDQHAVISLPWSSGEVVVRVDDDFGLQADEYLPSLGSASENLKISREQWSANNRDLKVRVAGIAGKRYALHSYGANIAFVDGGELKRLANGVQTIEITFSAADRPGQYIEREITIHF
ncbi:MAG TPA: amylo-alpha-1,6-glucosidase [Terriglobales bacterium]|nr:amylo-alpha-1,6-glucosidase [Terriglobales bacterium]